MGWEDQAEVQKKRGERKWKEDTEYSSQKMAKISIVVSCTCEMEIIGQAGNY